jgi:hypothetical protein
MATGRDARPIRRASSRCHALEPDPGPARDQRWSCRISFQTRAGRRGRAYYAMALDPRGCFVATSRDGPPAVFERAVGHLRPNPVVRLRSCP